MKISTRGRYGLKAIVDLAIHTECGDCECVNLKSIAVRTGLSENYLEQLIAPLKKAGYVKSVRGAQGGYQLSKPPESITVGNVLRALEGSLAPVFCLDEGGGLCGDSGCGACTTKGVWSKIYDGFNDVIDGITIGDLVNDYKSKAVQNG